MVDLDRRHRDLAWVNLLFVFGISCPSQRSVKLKKSCPAGRHLKENFIRLQ